MNKIVYITAKTPFGTGETFILNEMLALKKMGVDLLIIPRDKSIQLFHKKAEPLVKDTLIVPWLDFRILKTFLKFIVVNPFSFIKIINDIVFKARNIKIALKNLAIFPKATFLSKVLKKSPVSHIHAHWASTTSTMAYIISKITDSPWSFTAHRWDIQENNLLRIKCETAAFIRTIDEQGQDEIMKIVKDESLGKKIFVIHMGVNLPEVNKKNNVTSEIFTFICPSNFVPKKGHQYLFESCKILSDKKINFKCFIAGDGPLKNELETMANNLKLSNSIAFLGHLQQERLFDLYSSGQINTVVLSSILTKDGNKEGIPVALMEAMAYGIPVISTDTGGIPELIGDGSGIMVNEKDSVAIADAIEKLIKNQSYYCSIGERGRKKIERDFNETVILSRILKLISRENRE